MYSSPDREVVQLDFPATDGANREVSINSNSLPTMIYLNSMSGGNDNSFLAPDALRSFAADMRRAGLIGDVGYDGLLQAVASGAITANVDVLRYFDRALVFDCRELPDSPEHYYRIIYERLGSIAPGFGRSVPTIRQQVGNRFGDYVSYELVVSMRIDGREYMQSVFYAPEWKGKLEYFGMIGNDFHGIVNKWLADRGADYRLHYVECVVPWNGGHAVRYDRFGVIALRKDEYRLFDPYRTSVFQPRVESFSEARGPGRIRRMIAAYESIGLFSHLDREQIESATRRAMTATLDDANGVIGCFPGMLVDIDAEFGDTDHIYTYLTEDLAAITRGAFNPTDIHDGYVYGGSESFLYGFEYNGKRYESTLVSSGDWLDGEFLTLIDKAVGENVPDGRFYALDGGDERRIFLTTAQYRYLSDHQLLRFFPETYEEWHRLEEWE